MNLICHVSVVSWCYLFDGIEDVDMKTVNALGNSMNCVLYED